MYKTLIENYIKKLDYETFNNYVSHNYPEVDENEKKIIYNYLKNNWKELYDEDKSILDDLKKQVSDKTYQEIVKLLNTAYNLKNR